MGIATTSDLVSSLPLTFSRSHKDLFRLHSFYLADDGTFYVIDSFMKEGNAFQLYTLDPFVSEKGNN
jgi:hypothetical protein